MCGVVFFVYSIQFPLSIGNWLTGRERATFFTLIVFLILNVPRVCKCSVALHLDTVGWSAESERKLVYFNTNCVISVKWLLVIRVYSSRCHVCGHYWYFSGSYSLTFSANTTNSPYWSPIKDLHLKKSDENVCLIVKC